MQKLRYKTYEHLLQRDRHCIVVLDLVESVRLIRAQEEESIRRWLEVVAFVKNEIEKAGKARIVRSQGDGMLLTFDDVPSALKLAFACAAFTRERNADLPPDQRLHLRIGAEVGEVVTAEMDIYGHGVNMAARLAALGKPGEIVVSADVVSEFTPDLDARIEDMGDCYVKHVEEPVRAYRITPPGAEPVLLGPVSLAAMQPTIAVIPLQDEGDLAVGEVMAEELIRALSQSDRINVTSRLSTRAFRDGARTAREIGRHLAAQYILSGRCNISGGQVQVSLELVETRTEQVVWAETMGSTLRDILLGDQALISRVVADVGQAIHRREFQRARSLPLPNLESYSLLLGAINGMYRLSRRDFERAGEMLEHLIDREPRQPLPLAWLGNWHVLKVQQGWMDDPGREGSKARARTERALDLDPENDQALTIDGWVQTHLVKDFDAASDRFQRAIVANPSASMAWLLNGMMHGFRGEGETSVQMCLRARSLSPLDPLRFFYECLLSSAYLTAGRWTEAETSAHTSLRLNANHTSTLRCLAIAQYKLDKPEKARETVRKLTLLEPNLTVEAWQSNNPSATFEHGKEFASILKECGLPVS